MYMIQRVHNRTIITNCTTSYTILPVISACTPDFRRQYNIYVLSPGCSLHQFCVVHSDNQLLQHQSEDSKTSSWFSSVPRQINEYMSGPDVVPWTLYNFSWVVPGKLACSGWPRCQENIRFLANEGVTHLVTLSGETRPPLDTMSNSMNWTEIPVREFEAPTLGQINRFIGLCQRAQSNGDVICVHCHQGRGRTGVMAACYLARFQDLAPERAIINLRLMRPGSIETYEQERAVVKYHDALRHT